MFAGIFLKIFLEKKTIQIVVLERIILKTIRINFKTSKSHLEIRSDKFREQIH